MHPVEAAAAVGASPTCESAPGRNGEPALSAVGYAGALSRLWVRLRAAL